MFGYQLGQESAVHPARHVVPCRYGRKRTRIIVKADGVVNAGRFGGHAAVAKHALATVVEPPGRTQFHGRIVSRQRR